MNMLFQATKSRKAVLYDVLYVPKLTCNLFSVRAAVSKGNAIEFGPQKCCIRDEYGKLHGMGSLVDKLYQLDCQVAITMDTAYISVESSQGSGLWHQCLGHVHELRLKKCLENESVQGINIKKCLNCPFAKDVWQERCVENRSLQWEISARCKGYSWCTVTSAVQCTCHRLEEQSILLHLLIITLGAVLYTS